MSYSKLDELVRQAASEARSAEPSAEARAEALRALRAASVRGRPYVRRWVAYAGVATLAVVGIFAVPRPSEASNLERILQRPIEGVVREVHFVVDRGVQTQEIVVYRQGSRSKVVLPSGVEQGWYEGRTWTRDPKGYAVWDVSAEKQATQNLDLRTFLERSKGASVSKAVVNGVARYRVNGRLVDANGQALDYEASLQLDRQERPALLESTLEGLGHRRIEYTYGLSQVVLEPSPVPPARTYDLAAQRADLTATLNSRKHTDLALLDAFVDESGSVGVLMAVPEGAAPINEPMTAFGMKVEPINLSFNRYVGTGQDLHFDHNGELDGPVELGASRVLLRAFKPKQPIEVPFTLQFPFLTSDTTATAAHPFYLNEGAKWRLVQKSVIVPRVKRTSSLVQLLCPNNVPFFEKPVGGGAVLAVPQH